MTGSILYIGNFKHDFCTERHYARSFEELGWQVWRLQEQDAAARLSRILDLAQEHQPDLVLYTRTPPGLPPDATRVWTMLENDGHRTASVHLDLFHGLSRPIVWADPLFTTGTVFTADGDHDADWSDEGIHHKYLRAGVLRAECYRGREASRLRGKYDVGFVGSGSTYHAEWPHRQQLLHHLRATYGDRYRHVTRGLRGPELNAFYATVPVIVGDTLSEELAAARFWSDRAYEMWGRGGFLLHPRIDALWDELGLDGGLNGYPFGDFDRLDEAVADWLAHPSEREELRQRTQDRVRAHCTYTHRAAELLYELALADEPGAELEPLGLAPPIPTKEHQA